MIVKFQKTDGEQFNIDIPMTPRDIRYTDWCDFRDMCDKAQELTANRPEDEKLQISHDIEIIGLYIKALHYVCKGDVEKLPYTDMQGDKEINSLTGLLRHLFAIEGRYKPSDPAIELVVYGSEKVKPSIFAKKIKLKEGVYFRKGGVLYGIEGKRLARLISGVAGLSVGETVEVIELERRGVDLKVTHPHLGRGIDFNINLAILAILLRRKGEALPMDVKDRELWIEDRKKVFEEISFGAVLDVRAFFLLISARLALTRAQDTLLKVSSKPITVPASKVPEPG